MKKTIRVLIVCILAIFCFLETNAQVTGKVSDATGEGLPGVNIMEKGTTNGTITDFSGNFNLQTINEKPILLFSFIGFENKELACSNGEVLDVVLKEDVALLSEVVAVGYGTQIKREVTSSMSTIKVTEDEGGQSIGNLLQGKASGLQITNTDASPGASMRVTVRGTNSINSGVEPLWVIDGIPVNSDQEDSNIRTPGGSEVYNPLADLNTDDIESIQVLKDAASTSIYGSRGANGVILVTTKQGDLGKTKVSVNIEGGVSEAVNYKTYLNGEKYFEMVDEMHANSGIDDPDFYPGIFDYDNPKYAFYNREYAETVNNDWIDMLLKRGYYHKAYAALSGGAKGTKYFVSFYNKNQEGVMVGDKRNDSGVSLKLNFTYSKKLSGGVNTYLSLADYESAQKGGGVASRTNVGVSNWGGRGGWRALNSTALPVYPIYTPEGDYFDPFGGYAPYVASLRENQLNENKQYSANLNAFLDYKPFKGFKISVKGGINYTNRSQFLYTSEVIRRKSADEPRGSARGVSNKKTYFNKTLNSIFSYEKRVQDMNLNFMAGAEVFEKGVEVAMSDFEDLQSQQISMGDVTAATFLRGSYYHTMNNFLSFFGRFNGSLKNKYLLGFSLRYDGSSVFAPKNRWGGFGSVSGGWIVSDEGFMKELSALNLLKIRASYGSTGNASIPSFMWQNNYQTWPLYGEGTAYIPGNMGTDNLTWERSYTLDAAIDFGVLKNRISGSVGYYRTRTEDMLLNTPIAPSHGIYSRNNGPTALLNVGEMFNQGIELEITSTNINTKNFSWKTSFNIATNKNEVGELADGIKNPLQISYTPAFGSDLALNSVWTGHRLGRFYIAEYAGLDSEGFQTIYEIDQQKFDESGMTVTEKTGNVVRATSENVQKNRIYHEEKTGLPTYFGGISNTFSWKGLTLNIAMSFSGGNYIYDQTVQRNGFVYDGRRVLDADLYGNTWLQGVREDAKYPIQTKNNKDHEGKALSAEHTAYLHKGDYLRLQNVGLSYNFPKSLVNKLKLSNVTIYANVSNLFVWSYFKSFDPEFVNYGDVHAVTADRNLGQGYIKNDPFPKARTYSGGVRVSF